METWRKLPLELWNYIIELAYQNGDGDWNAARRASQVCRCWRDMLLSIPSIWQNVEMYEHDLNEHDIRLSFALFVKTIRDRSKDRIKNVKVILRETKVPGVAIRTLLDDDKLDKIVVQYTESFNGPFFAPPTCKALEAYSTHTRNDAVIIQNNHFESVRLKNVLPWSVNADDGISNGLKHLSIDLQERSKDKMTAYTISQCKDLETLHLENLNFSLHVPVVLNKLKKLSLVGSETLLKYLEAPSLDVATIYGLRDSSSYLSYLDVRPLRYLRIQVDDISDVTSSAFTNEFENLEVLQIDNNIPVDCPDARDLLKHILLKKATAKLKAIKISSGYHNISPILRAPQNLSKIEEFVVEDADRFTTDASKDLDDIEWLKKNIPKLHHGNYCNYDKKDSYFPITFSFDNVIA
ncbi:hypothetical protein WALSEDRAFT_65355 [Wallemia mellicola CBS 633.66]|uniref:F-box domain-containing protein n=1 Tax=Wallemia mellicola (strain ATCC MYA-4683 / CBS 633.66) TaxID=671144 RepID=I4Y907_WALMC|nr:hypothetical protein WALSEDRAFT_65355 [Wallemia mellicola CBS 633.66]EIM20449.1 hypothetical protein WALSEDRAFT_65355 [Wallemia mellicola CBS 633.66]|eukprot:XP_006959475.1 hypothetical protein WALSEDRAFT_65355 [Wallemia mellicola CBS 633.66]